MRRYARPRDYEVARWLSGNAMRLFGRNLAPVDAEYLVDLVGYDFDALRSELEKIDLYLDGRHVLEAQDDTFPAAGGVGLWTKADAASSFDNLKVQGE